MTFDEGGQHMNISGRMLLESIFSYIKWYIPMTQNRMKSLNALPPYKDK